MSDQPPNPEVEESTSDDDDSEHLRQGDDFEFRQPQPKAQNQHQPGPPEMVRNGHPEVQEPEITQLMEVRPVMLDSDSPSGSGSMSPSTRDLQQQEQAQPTHSFAEDLDQGWTVHEDIKQDFEGYYSEPEEQEEWQETEELERLQEPKEPDQLSSLIMKISKLRDEIVEEEQETVDMEHIYAKGSIFFEPPPENIKAKANISTYKKFKSRPQSQGTFIEIENDDSSPSSSQEFHHFMKGMDIPETPAREALSKMALLGDVKDHILDRFPETKETELSEAEEYVSKTRPRMIQCPSIESFFHQEKTANVNIYLYPGKKMLSKEVRLDVTIGQLKQAISRYCKQTPDALDFRKNHNLIADSKTLQELGAKPHRRIKFDVEINRRIFTGRRSLNITDPSEWNIASPPDTVRIVKFKKLDQKGKEIKVRRKIVIVHPKSKKPMIGGFLDQRTNLRYHDAATSPEEFDDIEWNKSDFHQACQTFNEEDFSSQTALDIGTQMERDDYYVTRNRDKVLYSQAYRSFEYLEQRRAEAVLVIQRYWRRWLAKQERKRRMDGLIARVGWAEKIRKGRIEERIKVMNEELMRQQNPTRLLDLELLYKNINNWRMEQEEYVKANRWGAERKAALATLTEMEADLLLELERTKRRIIENGRENSMHKKFLQMSLPKRWFGSKAAFFISYDTDGREKCRRLHDIYKELCSPVVNTSEGFQGRLDLINSIHRLLIGEKHIKTGQFPMADMLLELFARELKFMSAKASDTLLAGIRRRVSNTFFCLCKDPSFNEEAQRMGRIPWDQEKLRKNMMQCKGCRRMQYRGEFTILRGAKVTTRCHTCIGLYRTAILRIDLNLYRQLLNELRRDEFQAGVLNSVTFVIDAFDMRFLVEQIWHGQSALSGIDNRYMLRLCRWKRDEPWTPWNCVLLTEEEAVAHVELEDIDQAYQPSFHHKVLVKHATAKSCFEGLAKIAVGIDDRIAEGCEKVRSSERRTKRLQGKAKLIGMFQSSMHF